MLKPLKPTEPFHARLRRFRKAKRLTAKVVAQKIGVPESTYHEWEYGRSIQGEPYIKIAEALEVSIYELLSGKPGNKGDLIEKFDKLERLVHEIRTSLGSFF